MHQYANRSGKSSIVGYEVQSDAIKVAFQDGSVFLYTRSQPEAPHFDYMKQLAAFGHGLDRYISRSAQLSGTRV